MSYSAEPSVDISQLEKFLKSGLWRASDLETRKLLYLASGQSPANAQTTPPINLIPLPDLQAIDRLWTQYSKGRFGFSAQRPIWQACEQKFYTKTDAWAAFGDRVGWRINHLFKQNYWKKHNELNFAPNAPAGHLPHMGEKFGILTLEQILRQLDSANFIVEEPTE